MDKGTNAANMLFGSVKGRSQQDIIDKLAVKKGLEVEKSNFASHSVYSTMPPE